MPPILVKGHPTGAVQFSEPILWIDVYAQIAQTLTQIPQTKMLLEGIDDMSSKFPDIRRRIETRKFQNILAFFCF